MRITFETLVTNSSRGGVSGQADKQGALEWVVSKVLEHGRASQAQYSRRLASHHDMRDVAVGRSLSVNATGKSMVRKASAEMA